MTDWTEWDRSLALMGIIESNMNHAADHMGRAQKAAELLKEIPEPAIGPMQSVRETEHQARMLAALCKAIREKYEPKPALVAAE